MILPMRCHAKLWIIAEDGGPMSAAGGSGAHQRAARIVGRLAQSNGRASLADDLDLEPRIGARQGSGYVAQRERRAHSMPEGARGDPAHGVAVMPDGLIADGVRVAGLH